MSCAPGFARHSSSASARSRARARRRLDLDDPRLLQPAAEGASVRRRPRSPLPGARGRRSCSPARRGVRARAARSSARVVTRSGCDCSPPIARTACGACSPGSTRRCAQPGASSCWSSGSVPSSRTRSRPSARKRAASRDGRVGDREPAAIGDRGIAHRRPTPPPAARVVDLSAFQARGSRAASYELARKAVERAALEELAAHDRELLQELLERFAAEYAAAKRRESAVDFEDLQLAARDLLRDDDGRARLGPASLPPRDGRRVPGHEQRFSARSSTWSLIPS